MKKENTNWKFHRLTLKKKQATYVCATMKVSTKILAKILKKNDYTEIYTKKRKTIELS